MRDNVIRPHFGTRTTTPSAAHAAHGGKGGAAARPQPAPRAQPAARPQQAPAVATASAEPGYSRVTAETPRTPDFADALPFARAPQRAVGAQQLMDLDIPTFIRRQMD